MTRPPLSAPPAMSATVAVPWSVPSLPLMRAVRPNSVTRVTTVSFQASPILALIAAMAPSSAPRRLARRAFRGGEEFRGRPGCLGEIGAHLLDAAPLDARSIRLALGDAAGLDSGGEPKALLEHLRKGRIDVPVEIEHAQHGLLANRRQARRRPGEDRGGTAHDQRRNRPDREGFAAARNRIGARLEPGKRSVKPAGIDGAGPRKSAFQHVLSVEMRALPIWRGRRMHDGGVTLLIEAVHVWHGGIERKEAIERQPRLLALERECVVAAQLHPIGIADRRYRGKPVEGAAQHDGEKPRIAAFRAREPRYERPGEQHARAEQQLAPGRGVECCGLKAGAHHRLHHVNQRRWNSGAMTKSVSACTLVSARATACHVSCAASGPSATSTSSCGSTSPATTCANKLAAWSRRLSPPSQAALSSEKPLGADGRHNGSPSRACWLVMPSMLGFTRPAARRVATSHSPGRLILARSGAQASGAVTSDLATSLRSPSVSRNRSASRSTNAGGGSSAMKCRASLVETCLAVAGLRARSSNTLRPCWTPPLG